MRRIILLSILSFARALIAGEFSWTGGGDGSSWNNPQNWGGSGVPGAEDSVTISCPSDTQIILPEDGVTIAKVSSISGHVAFSGGPFSVVGSDQYRFNVEPSSEVTFLCSFGYGNRVIRPYLAGSVLNFRGGISGTSYFCTYGLGEVNVLDTACDIGTVSAGSNTFNLHVPITNAEGSVRAEFVGDSIVHFWTNVFETTGYFGLDNAWAVVHCHGYDQSFGNLYGLRGTMDTDSEKPMTVTFTQRDAITNSGFNWCGPLSLRMSADSTAEYTLDRSVDSTGALMVEGGVFAFTEKGAWPNMSALHVSGGKVRLPAGMVLEVPALYLDGKLMPPGTYGANPSSGPVIVDVEHFDGEGFVFVPRVEPAAVVEGHWAGGGDDTSIKSASNWLEPSIPDVFADGTLVATFAQAGTVATIDAAVSFKGIVFDAPGDFSLAAAGVTYSLGGKGYVARGSHLYTLGAPSCLTFGQVWDVAAGAALDIVAEVSSYDESANVLKTGKGALNLWCENTFEGCLEITNGQVNVYSSRNAFGRASGSSCVTLNEKTSCEGGVSLHFMPGAATTNEKPICVYGDGSQPTAEKGLYFDSETYTVFKGALYLGGYVRTVVHNGSELVIGGGFGRAPGCGVGFLGISAAGEGTRPLIRFVDVPADGGELSITHVGVWFDVAGGKFDRLETSGWSYFDTSVDYAWNCDGDLNFEGMGNIDLHGHDQRVGRILLTSSGYVRSSEGPATLYFNQRDNAWGAVSTNDRTIFEGALSLSKSGAYDFVQNCAAMSSGGIEVTEGRFIFTEKGSWVNGTNVVVRGSGRLVLASAQTFGRKVNVTIADTGVLELNDVTRPMSCRELFLPDGKGGVQAASAGEWGAVGSGAANESASLAGPGRLYVRGTGLVISIR